MEPRAVVGLLLAVLGLQHTAAGANVSSTKAHSKEECCHTCTRDPDCTLAVYVGTTCWLSTSDSGADDSDKEARDREVACMPKAHNRTEAEGYDCTDGQVQTWSSSKAQWCCAKHDVGCPFSCSLGYPRQKVAWSAEKKAWCCAHRKAPCEEHEEPHEEAHQTATQQSDDDRTSSKEEPSATKASTSEPPAASKAPATANAAEDDKALEEDTDAESISNDTDGATIASEAATEAKSEATPTERTTTPKPTTVPATSKARVATTKAVSTTKAVTAKSLAKAAEHTAQQCRCSQDTDYTGHDLYALPANTPEECCQACAVHPHCTVGILFVGRCSSWCWLKNSSAVVPGAPGRIACSAGKAHYLAEAKAVLGASCAIYGCGGYNPLQKCQCNEKCKQYGNCCFDNVQECVKPTLASCQRYGCDAPYVANRPCQCNRKCDFYGNCCADYRARCGKDGGTLVFKKFELPAGPEGFVAESKQGRLLALVAQVGQGRLLVLASALLMALLAVAVRLRRPRRHRAALVRQPLAGDEAVEGGLAAAEEEHGESLLAWWAE